MEKRIIKELIKTYEKSQGYKDQEAKNRRVIIKPERFRSLNFEDYEVKSAFFEALGNLKAQGILDYSWVRFEEGNLVERIWLNQKESSIDRAYSLLGITPTYNAFEKTFKDLDAVNFTTYPWVEDFKKDLWSQFELKGKFGQLLGGDHEHQRRVVTALIALEERKGQPVHERVFSTEVYGDSKEFQKNIKKTLKSLLKRYLDDVEESDLLHYMGIYTNPEIYHFCGEIKMEFTSGTVDFSVFSRGAVLPAIYGPEISRILGEGISRVLFIENQATYEDFVKIMRQDDLIVYHGGFANKRKHQFFQKLALGLPHTSFYHWSDFDLGGIRIFKAIKATISNIHPYLMNSPELSDYKEKGMEIGKEYKNKIQRAMELENDPKIKEMYKDLLHFGVRLEQENINW